jgi:predicted permease
VFGSSSDFFVTSHPPADVEFSPLADMLTVDGGYFDALRIPLLAGRTFEPRDNGDAPNFVIVSEALARKYFPHASPVGERLNIGGTGDLNAYTIIGVVGNVRYDGVAQDPSEAMYLPFAQSNPNFIRTFSVVIRSAGRMDVTSALRAAVRRVDSELAIAHVRTMDELVEASLAGDRFRTLLLGLFALLALVLAAVGIYGVMAYAVGRRAREIGIRRALGARDSQIYRLILREGMIVAGVGVAIGLTASFALTRVVTKLLYGVSATDAATFVGVPLILLGIAVLACVVPARRAARVDPSVTMRGD